MRTTTSMSMPMFARCAALCSVASIFIGLWPLPAAAGLTDLTSSPIAGTTTVQTKPNIMLLMDTSGSMGWTHMPDEVEGPVNYNGQVRVGYKSAQCNVLYYNPLTTYELPKKPDGITSFPTPAFDTAPYAGYASYYATPDAVDLSSVDLGSNFQAYDAKTLRFTNSSAPDTPQAAYYYVYTGPQALTYASPACAQNDTGASQAATGGGTWTRKLVSATSGRPTLKDERQNFANWYSFYRTRISLIKSAASLAFTPLTDSFRVGFITVEPKDDPSDLSINQSKYVAIADFNLAQRNIWFNKLFAQSPKGASPAREGLARVGRHYAGKFDGINKGMDGDPVQYSCQQNFTIMTTDGYWNSQTESPGGGPVKEDGITRVGQQDGAFTPFPGYTSRPIWEGQATDTQVSTNKTNQFGYVPCGTYVYVTTTQFNKSTTQSTASTSQLTQSTKQTTASTSQKSVSTSQTTESTLQHKQRSDQINRSTLQQEERTSQLVKSTSQLVRVPTQIQTRTEQIYASTSQRTRSTTQDTKSTSQLTVSTLQTRIATSRVDRRTAQVTQSTSQLRQSTSQTNVSTSQLTRSTNQPLATTSQKKATTSQLNRCDTRDESCTPVPSGSCTPGGYYTCEVHTTGPTPVADCVDDSKTEAANNFTSTSCSTTTSPATPVASCTSAAANSSNSYTSTACSSNSTGPTPVASCTPIIPNTGNNYTTTSCNTATTGPTPTASCSPSAASSTNNWTATTCPTTTSPPVGVNSCSASPANSGNFYTATSCNTVTTGPTGVSGCAASSASSSNNWVETTCSTNNTPATPVSSCTPATASSSNSWVSTFCDPVTTGPTPIASCSPSNATNSNSWTTTTCPNVASGSTGVASCTPVAANNGNSYTATNCAPVNTGPNGVAPGSCVAATASSSNSYVETTCDTATTGPTPVSGCANVGPTSNNGYVNTTCNTVTTSPTLVASCSPVAAGSANNYTATTCTKNPATANWTNAGSCTPETANAGNNYTARYCRTTTGTATGVGTCTPTAPNGSGAGNTCNTITTGPIGVATCTNQTGNAANKYVDITCNTVLTGPTLVASCTPQTAQNTNSYVATTCNDIATGPTPVASCTPDVATSGNNFTTTTCTTNSTGPTAVSSCTAVPATSGNNYTSTSCPDVSTGPTPVASCTSSPASSTNSYVQTSCNTATSGPTLAASCTLQTAASGNNWLGVTCTDDTTGPTPVSSCTPDPATAANNFVGTSCNTTTSPSTGVASCTPVSGTAANNWTETLCSTVTNTAGVTSCSAGPANGGNNYTATTCNTVNTGPTPVASCSTTAADSSNGYTATSCNTVTSGPTLDTSCTPAGAGPGNNYTATTCTVDGGRQIQFRTTTTVTTTPMNNGFPTGPAVVGTPSVSASTTVGACYATGTEPPLPSPNPQPAGPPYGPNPPAGCSAWPCSTSTANSFGSTDSLADVAQYYYVTDLRPGMEDNVKPPFGSGAEHDRATWQHMTTFTIALGVSGTLEYKPDYRKLTTVTGDFAHIRTGLIPAGDTSGTGAVNWPVWPDPAINYDGFSGGSFANWDNPKSIDDFWHAAVNGRGEYFSAGNPSSVIAGLSKALASFAGEPGAGSAVTASNFKPVTDDNFAYAATFETSTWVGEVTASEIDVTTGVISSAPYWSAQALLDAQTKAQCDNRKIYLLRAGAGAPDNKVNFTWNTKACDAAGNPTGAADTGMNSAEMAHFGASSVSQLSQYLAMTDGTNGVDQRTPAVGANLVNFLRGQRGFEAFVADDAGKLYREREHVLGDIVGGQPVYVKGPFASYQDADYAAFKSTNAMRTPMLYVAANDGMLHAFFAGVDSTDTQGGKEAWAFIPSTVLPYLYKLADDNYKNIHRFYVDGTPTVGDAHDGTAWKTILVGGLNGGGKGYYALDVTDPAAPKGLWEFKADSGTCPLLTSGAIGNTSDCHLGFTFGKPIISKLAGRWVVMFTSGYNNINSPSQTGDGVGYLYVLDAFSGQIVHKIATTAGSAATPSGLAQISAFVDASTLNNTTKQVYGGDTLGNIWRFDVNDTIAPSGREATLIGVATDSTGTPQPITTRPELAELNSKPMIFVGTGRLLGATDFTDIQPQSVYGIVDPLLGSPVYANLRASLKPLELTQSGTTRTIACSGNTAQCGSLSGWVIDLPEAGERVNVDMKLARGTLAFASNVPGFKSICEPVGHSWLNSIDFATGLAVSNSPGLAVSKSDITTLAVGLTLIEINNNLVGVRTRADGKPPVRDDVPSTAKFGGKRISWREIAQ